MKKEKCIIFILVLVIVGLCLGFFSLYDSNMDYKKRQEEYNELKNENSALKKKVESYEKKEEANNSNEVYVSSDGNYDRLEILSVNDFHIKQELKETFILVITQTGCGHCTTYKPILNKVLEEYDLKVYEINISNLTYDDRDFLNKLVKYSGTPTTFFYEDGEENLGLRIVGSASEEKITSRLEEAGYIS